jgi:hypothetical protein
MWHNAAVSKREQLPENGQVGPKHVAIDYDFGVVLDCGEIVKNFKLQ